MLIEHILHRKGHQVETISADATVTEALARLRDRNIGALVVTSGGDGSSPAATGAAVDAATIRGILSERDIVRALAGDAASADTLARPVSALMSTDLTTCGPRATVDELMRVMTHQRIRHIPVIDGGRLSGIVSIGDVVKSRIDELEVETSTLHEYLASGR